MDVEKIQRINNLARELEKQGLADGREDAVAQARKIFNVEEKTIDSTQMHEGTLQAKNDEEEEIDKLNQQNLNDHQLNLSQEKISDILKKNSRFLVSTIKGFQAKIENLEQEVTNIKSRMHTMSVSSGQRPKVETTQTNTTETENDGEGPVESTSTNPQGGDHPRSGGYNATDVSIEKFFYMGSK